MRQLAMALGLVLVACGPSRNDTNDRNDAGDTGPDYTCSSNLTADIR